VPRNRFVKDFFKRLREHRKVTDEEEDRVSEAIDRLFNLQEYPFTAMELSSTMDEEQGSEVFVRINSKGKSWPSAASPAAARAGFDPWSRARTRGRRSWIPGCCSAMDSRWMSDPDIRRFPARIRPLGRPAMPSRTLTTCAWGSPRRSTRCSR